MINLIKKNNLFLVSVFFLFVVLTFFVGTYHEAWLDEAQSWLIARDCGFLDIVFTRCSYEGTPFLWYYILKVFILLGGSYKYIFIISWLFSCLGIYLFLFRSKFPTIIKILTPFTFYIFYQYTVIARPYCLLFPILCLIAIFYEKRFESPYLYCFLLALLASVHAYGFVISFMLACFFICDFFCHFEQTLCVSEESRRCSVIPECLSRESRCSSPISPDTIKFSAKLKANLPIIILFFYMLFIAFTCKKNPDCDYVQKNIFLNSNIIGKFITAFIQGYFNINSFFSFLASVILTVSLYISCVKTFCKTKRQIIYFIALNFAVYVSIVLVNFYDWHLGIILFTLLLTCLLFHTENKINLSLKNNKFFYIVILIVIFTQIFYSCKTSFYEIKKEYDGAKTVANFIKENNFKPEDIIGFGCRAIAIQPYFDKNIFINKDTTYYHWSKKLLFKEIENTKEKLDSAKIFITDKDIIPSILYKDVMEYIADNCSESFTVESDMYIKGEKFNSSTTYYVFVRNGTNFVK